MYKQNVRLMMENEQEHNNLNSRKNNKNTIKTPPMWIIKLRRIDKKIVYSVGTLIVLVVFLLFCFGMFHLFKKAIVITKYVPKQKEIIVDENTNESVVTEIIEKIEESNNTDALFEFNNLAIVDCDSFINVRKAPDVTDTRAIIGKMFKNSACDVLQMDLSNSSIYAKIKSGSMVGYVAKKYLITGDEALNIAKENIKERAEILVDKLWMRSSPTTESDDNKIGATYKGERFVIVGREDGFLKIEADDVEGYEFAYISADTRYVSIKQCLNVARTQNLKNDVLNYYDNIGVSTANSYVNIRSSAKDSGTSNIIGKLPRHAGCEILSKKGDWYKIRSGKITGYVTKSYIASGKTAENLAIQYADLRAIVKIDALRVRKKPNTNSKVWTTISKEETYVVKDQMDGWVQIEIEGGNNKNNAGYISTSQGYVEVRYALDSAIEFKPAQVAKLKVNTKRKNVVTYATQFVGNPYVWGGTSLTSGADCSGFVQTIMKKYGVSLPRTARDQAKKGTARTSANKQPGDLIFYSGPSGVIDHVAIYIGNNQIVHAASAKSGIKISRWNYRTPEAIRNVLGN